MPNQNSPSAPLSIVGLGPGNPKLLAPEAAHLLERCQAIAGYQSYLDLLDPELLQNKIIIASGMTQEVNRAVKAIRSAQEGYDTVLVCSGDPGVYALAGLVLELLESQGIKISQFPLRIVPGIPAVCAAAALLGAPLTHDFACVSLSDLLTPWTIIRKRLHAALDADFVCVLYNPRSHRRRVQLQEALTLAIQFRAPCTPVGIVRNAYRSGQSVAIELLETLAHAPAQGETVRGLDQIDMLSLLIIGNKQSRIIPSANNNAPLCWAQGARMLTPRGYKEKYSTLF